ncbi:N-acetyltransferase [Balneolaceae bacterium YR4-1]|uniref:N-acetyltransferase n=1 Tax=Halalkalibaculum roseum TaxID=2709311 RepID=A0A6M1SX82_9BACT|nr:GNAT family N-acetyltransferase [Halalkalibaculum roseum]NGP76838.1 N-acetyltransferase [Halalkalibaculum roseum]
MITRAQKEHLPEINDIYNQAINDGLRTAHLSPISEQERLEWFEHHDNEQFPIFVWLDNDTVLGWLSVSPYRSGRDALSEVAEISYYVDYNRHGEGIASELMKHAIAFCSRASYRILVAILISGNEESIGLLHKFGFEESGRIKRAIHYKDIYRDHLYMSLNVEK